MGGYAHLKAQQTFCSRMGWERATLSFYSPWPEAPCGHAKRHGRQNRAGVGAMVARLAVALSALALGAAQSPPTPSLSQVREAIAAVNAAPAPHAPPGAPPPPLAPGSPCPMLPPPPAQPPVPMLPPPPAHPPPSPLHPQPPQSPPLPPAPPAAPGELSLLLESGATYAFGGHPITVSGAGVRVRISTTGAAPATLDAQRLSRHFVVLGATLELDNLILVNGCPRVGANPRPLHTR